MTAPFTVLIPARMASTRLPDKPLALLGNVPMVVRVAQRALQSSAVRTVVACDSTAIADACAAHGIEAVMTGAGHRSGSDRLAEACALLGLDGGDLVVNVQGDEPLIDPGLIDAVARLLDEDAEASVGTAAHAIDSHADFVNPNVVKVVLNARNRALYFSRAPIAWWRDGPALEGRAGLPTPPPLRHIGIYSYRAAFLRLYPSLPPAPLEVTEALEQLRAMWHGYQIAVHVTQGAPASGVDTPEDLERVRLLL